MKRGELWWTDFDAIGATRGREQAGRRPALILSADRFNTSPLGLVIVIPLSRTNRGFPTHVAAGTTPASFIMCEQLRSVSKARLVKILGSISPPIMARVEDAVRLVLGQ